MLQRVIENLREQGFDRIVVNVHHFAGQVVQFLNEHDFGIEVMVSDETGVLPARHRWRIAECEGAFKAGDRAGSNTQHRYNKQC